MSDDYSARIAETKERLLRWQQAKAELPPMREKLTQASHQVQLAEATIDELEQALHGLQSFSLTGLFESMTGNKQRKVDEYSAQLEELEPQLQEAHSALATLEQQVAQLEAAVADGASSESAFRAACDEKARLILQRGDEQAARLTALNTELEAAGSVLRGAQKAQEIGRQLSKSLESLDRAVRNAKHNKRMAGNKFGAVGHLMNQAVAGMAPKSAITPVNDGLRRFVQAVGALPLTDHHDDINLARLRAELDTFATRLTAELSGLGTWEQIETLSVQQQVQVALSHLKDWVADVSAQVTEVQQKRDKLIEQA